MKTLLLLIAIVLLASLAHAEVYKWQDDNGAMHFTDNPFSVPVKYREKVYAEAVQQIKKTTPNIQPPRVLIPQQVSPQVINQVQQHLTAIVPQINNSASNQANIERQRQIQEIMKQQRAKAAEQGRKSTQAITSTLLKYGLFCVIGGSMLQVVMNNKFRGRRSRTRSRSWSGESYHEVASHRKSPLRVVAKRQSIEHEPIVKAYDYHQSTSNETTSTPANLTWDDPVLGIIEWRRIEIVCVEFFKMKGYRAQETRIGADGGVDINLYIDGLDTPAAVVQCKAWNAYKVGVKPIRELYGVMAADQVEEGFFVTSGEFTRDALDFAEGKKLHLMTGERLLSEIKKLPQELQKQLLKVALDGDYTTPTCPQCDVKMAIREGKSGRNAGGQFWGCVNFPRCKQTFKYKNSEDV